MRIPGKKYSRLWLYLLYLGLVTTLIVSVTLARYAATTGGSGTATVAAMAAGGGEPIRMVIEGMFPGSDPQTLQFKVVNYKDDAVSEVALDYDITVETTGNLPLEFELAAARDAGTAGAVTDTGTILTGGAKSQTLTGGAFPLVQNAADGKLARQEHTYTLTVNWPQAASDAGYADEIDLVTVTMLARQRLSTDA